MKFARLIPELTVKDLNKSLEFYQNVLGFKLEYARPENKFAFISFKGAQLMLEEGKKPASGEGMNFQIETEDLDALAMSIKKANYPFFKLPGDKWFRVKDKLMGQREFVIKDLDGYLLRFCKDIGEKPVKD